MLICTKMIDIDQALIIRLIEKLINYNCIIDSFVSLSEDSNCPFFSLIHEQPLTSDLSVGEGYR